MVEKFGEQLGVRERNSGCVGQGVGHGAGKKARGHRGPQGCTGYPFLSSKLIQETLMVLFKYMSVTVSELYFNKTVILKTRQRKTYQ